MKLSEVSDSTRKILFWLVCIPLRISIALITALAFPNAAPAVKYVFGIVYLIPVIWWSVYILGIKHRTAGAFKQNAFWANARPIHAVLWLTASVLTFIGTTDSYRWAGGAFGADIMVGVALWLVNYDVAFRKPDLPT
tara:strand:+ start:15922 stop:16332 length:411 start_codon:yes stop_codon:yes gene_type:complete